MDCVDLLARENEFKKLNKQLEKKTESLIKEIENVMQNKDIFSEFSKLSLSPAHRETKKHCCSTPETTNTTPEKKCTAQNKIRRKVQQNVSIASDNGKTDRNEDNRSEYITNGVEDNSEYNNVTNSSNTRCNCDCYILSNDRRGNDFEFLYAFVSVNVKDNVLPASFLEGNLTVESVCKFLAAKVKLLQEQIDKLQATIDKKAAQCERHMGQLAGLEGERLSLRSAAHAAGADAAAARARHAAALSRLQEKDRLYKEQRSATDRLTNEAKQLKNKNASLEARCASHDETVATLRQQLEVARMTEKEFRDSTRTLSASHQSTIQRLEARVKTLALRADRQTALIDNLKKQNALLQTDAAVRALEKEYCEFLKQDF